MSRRGKPVPDLGARTFYLGADEPLSKRVLRVLQESGVELRGRVTHVQVLHDDECPMLDGGAGCKCRPDIRVEDAPA
jgi:hypothetical protein